MNNARWDFGGRSKGTGETVHLRSLARAITARRHNVRMRMEALDRATRWFPLVAAYHLCKQFGPRSDPTFCRARSGSKPFDPVTVFPKDFLKTFILKKKIADDKIKFTQHAKS